MQLLSCSMHLLALTRYCKVSWQDGGSAWEMDADDDKDRLRRCVLCFGQGGNLTSGACRGGVRGMIPSASSVRHGFSIAIPLPSCPTLAPPHVLHHRLSGSFLPAR
eukprot:11254503-Alexandrium_andersonii.AAC.1